MTGGPGPFGQRLRQFRETSGLTQEQLAEKAGLSVQGVASLENGRSRRPYPHTLRALADALGLSPQEHAELASAIPSRASASDTSSDETDPSSGNIRLPNLRTDLIGRERELDTLADMLRDGARIVTLTGPGGVGKTSLALQGALNVSDLYPDGATFVPLGPIGDSALVLPTIVHALQLPSTRGETIRDSVQAFLRDKRVLLVLDNFEHVLDAAIEIADLVAECDELAVLVTSRAPLRVRREQEFPVQPLKVPDLARIPDVDDIAGNPAAELFANRARAAVPGFRLDRENAAAIAAICRRLDGLPLAIELAAARVRVLSPTALLSRLDSALPLLSGGARDLPERQRTMRRAIEWSYDLLDEPEQRLFTRLSVFRGGWPLEAAEAVGVDEEAPIDNVLGTLSMLVEQSLVFVTSREDGSDRYRMLVPVRELAEDYLTRNGLAGDARQRHAAFYRSLASQAAAGLTGPQQVEWLTRLETERDNVRAALDWLMSIHDWDAASELAWSLWIFWWIRGYHAEGRAWMDRLLQEGSNLSPIVRARALGTGGSMALGQGDIPQAEAWCSESVAIATSIGDNLLTARSMIALGLIASARGDIGKATSCLQQAADIHREAGDHFWAALATSALGMLPFRQGDYDRAEALLEEGSDLAHRAGDRFSRYIALYNQSQVAQKRGDHARAGSLFRDGLVFSMEVGDRANIAYCLEGLASVANARGDAGCAAVLLGAAHTLFEAVGTRVYTYRPGTSLREATMAAVRDQMDEKSWDAAWNEGKQRPLDEVVAMAMKLAEALQDAPNMSSVSTSAVPVSEKGAAPYGLTRREIEILKLLVRHHSYREISESLFISPRTVGTHVTSIRNKLGASSPREAVRIAAELGLV